MRSHWLAIGAAALVACEQSTPPVPDLDRRGMPPVTLSLNVGETRQVHGTNVTFVGVFEDSRCGTDVVCAWAGNAGAEIGVGPAVGRGPTQQLRLNTGLEPRQGVAWDLRVRLTGLQPQPRSTHLIPPDDYVVELEVAGVDAEARSAGLSVTTNAREYAPGTAVRLHLRNDSDQAYWFNACMAPLERASGSSWVMVVTQRTCAAIAQALPARDTAGAVYPLEPDLADGDYRIVLELAESVVVRSNWFRIER